MLKETKVTTVNLIKILKRALSFTGRLLIQSVSLIFKAPRLSLKIAPGKRDHTITNKFSFHDVHRAPPPHITY